MLKIKSILFVFFAIILALAILELALRFGGYGYLHLKYPTKIVERKPNEFNILCFGDSFTLGIGAPNGKGYPDQLERLLRENYEKSNFNVYKEFRINSSTVLKYLTRDIERYSPDLVIVMIGCNDRWSLENCTYFKLGRENLLTKIGIPLSSLNVYKLAKIFLLNSTSLFTNVMPQSNRLDTNEESDNIYSKFPFKNQTAAKHFQIGQDYFSSGNYDRALEEFKVAEKLDPRNPCVHFRLACIYLQVLHDYDLGKKYALSLLSCGDSSTVMPSFMLLSYAVKDMDEMVAEMKGIIESKYKTDEKAKSLRNLKILSLFQRNNKEIEKIIDYNLNEIIKIARQDKIKIVLMQYPHFVFVREIINRKANLFKIPLVDNYVKFEDELRSARFKKEDLFAADGHCNANGYGLISQNVYDFLISNKLILVENKKNVK